MKTPTDAKETKEQNRLRPECQRQSVGTLPPTGVSVETSPVADWVNSGWFRQWEALAYGSVSH
mgnify:CR=1 FL=1